MIIYAKPSPLRCHTDCDIMRAVEVLMDIYCPFCREPWDMDELHEVEGMTFAQAQKAFRSKGCGVVFGTSNCKPTMKKNAVISAVYDLLGDDLDGAAAELEDASLLGLLDEGGE